MLTLAKKAEPYFRDYVRGGGKANRKVQVSRIIDFLDWVESNEKVTALHRIGKRHVVKFWISHRNFPDETAYKYWLGVCKLWEWLEKHEEPPKPHKQDKRAKKSSIPSEPVFNEIPAAIRAARESMNLTISKLANMTGCEVSQLTDIENGNTNISLMKILKLFSALKIEVSLKMISNKNS